MSEEKVTENPRIATRNDAFYIIAVNLAERVAVNSNDRREIK